jgi:hypothetical protein
MTAERVVSLKKILQHLAERQPKIVLHRVEKIFPALKESFVSVVLECAGNSFIVVFLIYADIGEG